MNMDILYTKSVIKKQETKFSIFSKIMGLFPLEDGDLGTTGIPIKYTKQSKKQLKVLMILTPQFHRYKFRYRPSVLIFPFFRERTLYIYVYIISIYMNSEICEITKRVAFQ